MIVASSFHPCGPHVLPPNFCSLSSSLPYKPDAATASGLLMVTVAMATLTNVRCGGSG